MSWKNSALNAVASIILGTLSTACTVEHFPNGSSNFIPSNQSFDSMFSIAQLKCEDPNNCPGNVGLIVFKSVDEDGNRGFSQCTGTLVGEDIVLTASHCLPDEVKYNRIDCGTQVGFIRSSSDRFPQKIRCAEILHFSADFNNTFIDYAFFRLKEKAAANPTRISRQGVPDNLLVYSYVVDPASRTSIQGLMKKKTCRSTMRSIVATNYVHPLSKLVGLTGQNCMLIGGNSGSSMMTDDEIRAVVSQGRKTPDRQQLIRGKDTPLGAAVNLACLEFPSGFSTPGSDCRSVPVDDVTNSIKTTAGIARHSATALQQVVSRAPLYRYRFEIVDRQEKKDTSNNLMNLGQHEVVRAKFTLTPACVVPRGHWSSLGILPQIAEDGSQAVMTSPPASGELAITLVIDDSTRVVVQSRALNITDRMQAVRVNSLGSSLPWCTSIEMAQKILL